MAGSPAIASADDTGGVSSSPAAASSDASEVRKRDRKTDDAGSPDEDSDSDKDDAEEAPAEADDGDEPDVSEQPRKQRRSAEKPAATDVDEDPVDDADPAAPASEIPIAESTAVQPLSSSETPSLGVASLPDSPEPGETPILAPAMWVVVAASRRDLATPNTAPIAGLSYRTSPGLLTGKVRGDIWARDPDRDRLTYTASAPVGGTVTVNRYGNFSYTPSPDARHAAAAPGGVRTDTFTITVSDGAGGTAAVPVTVAIKPLNARPTARNTVVSSDPISGVVRGTVIVTDRDGDAVTYTAPPRTARGAVTLNSDGSFVYTPTAEAREDARSIFRRLDSFTITVNDGHGGTDTTTVYVRVTPRPDNSAPTDGVASVGEPDGNGVVVGTVTATDANGDTLTYGLGSTSPARGTVVVSAAGSFTYTPTAAARHAASAANAGAELRKDSFAVTVSDGKGGTLTVPVTVAIKPANTEPFGGRASFGEADSTTGVVTGTLTARDDDNDTLTFSGSATTTKGEVVVSESGEFTYTPTLPARQQASEIAATDTFTVTVTDGHGGSDTFDVTVPISPLPASGEQPATGVIAVPNPSGGALDYEVSNDASVGTATVDPAGRWTYTPTPDARHQAAADDAGTSDKQHTFTVTVTDSQGNTTVVPITVSIVGANEVPVATEQPDQQLDPETGVTSGVLIVTDADGDPLAADIEVDPAQGTVDYDIATGVWTFEATPEARHAAAAALAGAGGSARMMRGFVALAEAADPTIATVTFTFRDGYGGVQTAVVDVQISPANEEPVVTTIAGGAPNSGTGIVTGTVEFTDPDGDAPIFTVGTSAKGIEVTFDEVTGQWTYTPTAAVRAAASAADATTADRLDSFTISVDDGHGGVGSVDITVPILFGANASGDIALTGKTARPIVIPPDGRHVYISTETIDFENGTTEYGLTVVDTATRTGYIVPLPGEPDRPIIISTDGAHAYATVGNTVVVIDTGTATTTSVILPGVPDDFVVTSPDGVHAYATSQVGSTSVITAIDAVTGAAVDITLPGSQFVDMTFSERGEYAYVTSRTGSAAALTVIDAGTNATRTIALPDHLSDTIHVTPDGLRAFTMTAAVDGAPAAFMVIDLVTGEFEPGVTWADGQNLTPVTYSADSRYAYLVVRVPGEDPGTYEDFFVGIDTDVMEGGGGLLQGVRQGSIHLSADGSMAYLLMDNYIAYASPFGGPGGSSQFRGQVTGDLLISDDGAFAYVPTYRQGDHTLTVVDIADDSSYAIYLPAQLNQPVLSADGTQILGYTSTRGEGGIYEHALVSVDLATAEVQSIVLPGGLFDTITLSPDKTRAYSLTGNFVTETTFTYLLSIVDVPTPPIVLPSVAGVPQVSAAIGTTGRGFQLVYDENADTTTVLVADPDGHVIVAGTVSGDAESEIVPLVNGGVAFVTYDDVGSPDGPVVRLVTVSDTGAVSTNITGGEGQWVQSAAETHYYLAYPPAEDYAVAVWRVTADGDVALHSHGYRQSPVDARPVVGTDGTLYLAVSQFAPMAELPERASLWSISPTGVESIVALTALDGTDIKDLSHPASVAVAADGTAYLLAVTVGTEPDGRLNQSVGVLVVGADGSVHRHRFANVPAGAMNIVAAGGRGVFAWFDRTDSWVAVIDAAGNRVDHPIAGVAGEFVSTTDGSGAYASADADTLVYVNSAGAVSTIEVGPYRGDVVTGPGATVYVFDPAGGRLVTVTEGVASSSSLGTSFRSGSLQFSSDGTPFALLTTEGEYFVALPSAGILTEAFPTSDVTDVQLEIRGDTAYIAAPGYDGTRLLAITSDGATVFDVTLGPDDQSAGPVAIGADGTFYYAVYEELPSGAAKTHVFAANGSGTRKVFSADGAPPFIWDQFGAGAVVAAADGTLYVSTVGVKTDPEEVVTTVHVVPPTSGV